MADYEKLNITVTVEKDWEILWKSTWIANAMILWLKHEGKFYLSEQVSKVALEVIPKCFKNESK